MTPIDVDNIEHDGSTYRICIYADADQPNPLDDWSEMGSIVSLNRRHANSHRGSVDDLLEEHPDAVPLSYFEHGMCLWSVAGKLPVHLRCPWDSVGIAGFWLPDAETLASAKRYGGSTRRHFMRKRARQACDVYTRWCNGDVYGYEIHRVIACSQCGEESTESLDSCWGFFGLEYCRTEANAALGHRVAMCYQENSPEERPA